MTTWLIEENAAYQLAEAKRVMAPSVGLDQVTAFQASRGVASGDPKNVTRAGSTMEIRVEGVLTEKPDLFAAWFGGGNTTYDSIARALAQAASDGSVRDVVMYVNSPGGSVDGLFEALAAIESFTADSGKKLRVVASKAQSAAFAIAAAAGPITAKTPASMFGSIGTAIDFTVFSGMRTVSITNTDSPAKRPDPTTDSGRAEIVRLLDSINGLFVDAIARGRGVTTAKVSSDFGRGATLLAADARKRGMIDSISGAARTSPRGMGALWPGYAPSSSASGTPDMGDLVVAALFGSDEVGSSSASAAPAGAPDWGDVINADLLVADEGHSSSAAAGTPDMGDLVVAALFGDDAFDNAHRPRDRVVFRR